MAETSRDVLAEILRQAEAAGFSPSYTPDRIRAAIAADDAERERLRRIEDAAREFVRRLAQSFEDHGPGLLRAEVPGRTSYEVSERLAVLRVALLPPTMRQLDAAQRIAGEMPELRRRHARAAVEGGDRG